MLWQKRMDNDLVLAMFGARQSSTSKSRGSPGVTLISMGADFDLSRYASVRL